MELLNKILRYPEKIPCDIRLHFIIGSITMMIITMIPIIILFKIALLLIVSFGIEIYQFHTNSGKYSNFDALAVILGGLVVIIPEILKG